MELMRLNLINSIAGYKPANLIASVDASGQTNVAVFNSVMHIGSQPPTQGFIMRPLAVPRHTYANIKETGVYTINHIHADFIEKAHYTSAKFEAGVSEFEQCKLTPEYLHGFAAPFVAESQIKLGMRLVEEVPIRAHDTILLIGEIEHLILPDTAMQPDGKLKLGQVNDVAITGLNTYGSVTELATFPYARVNQLPGFTPD